MLPRATDVVLSTDGLDLAEVVVGCHRCICEAADIGILVAVGDIPVEHAEYRLRGAARRAGISDAQMARAILELFENRTDDGDQPR